MQRQLLNSLLQWQTSSDRMPLLIRGARQVGKTFLVEQFGQQCFEHAITINLEQQTEFLQCFETLKPDEIVKKIELTAGRDIIPGKTLLFLDEIQSCPQAIMALRYFKEQMPELHVIGAGSLLEFALRASDFKMPVGRVQFLYLYPLTFMEFLLATGHEKLHDAIRSATTSEPLPGVAHDKLLKLLREYILIGGMPAAVSSYVTSNSLQQCQDQLSILLNAYPNDFGKYAEGRQLDYLQVLYDKIPRYIAQQFRYSKVMPDVQSRDIKPVLQKLEFAGLVIPVRATSAAGLPLNALINEKKFKLLFLDVGLVNRASRVEMLTLLNDDLLNINQGAIAEQFVGQELLAQQDPILPGELFFWARDQKNSQAEVDYVVQVDDRILPVEVKSGKTGRLKSLQLFMAEKQAALGIRLATRPLQREDNVLSIPLYMVSEIKRLVRNQLRT